ncbi:MAG: hypothetical protein CMD16_03685 [Flavobacteriales bacterium]|nr:hypothetical protein [Flavobacteriales bacterium]|tara:strand:+ start:6774 stop:8675 length:1902 start_codon:yes stop_codon:yes gene_type:complete
MRVALLLLGLLCFNLIDAQECYPETSKEKRVVRKVQRLIKERAYYDAFDRLRGVSESAIFHSLRSEILWRRADYFNAEKEALKAIAICPQNSAEAYYFIGEIAYNRKDYLNADAYLKIAIDIGIGDPYYSDAIMLYQNASILAGIISQPVKFNPVIVKGVSTKYDEYLPILSADQELLFFTRRSIKKTRQSITSNIIEEFVFSTKQDKMFSIGAALSYPFNQEANEGGASLTIDNKILYYTKCQLNGKGYRNCDIFYVFNNNGSWSEVQSFPDNISMLDSWESQPTVSSDGKTIIFSSDRKGGYGKMDLYEINYNDGQWSAPKNLGDKINSSEYEKSPYLHTDGKTLFFASTNFPSLGGFDVFYSRKDSLGYWQTPINIGYPINTVSDEISLFVSTDGDKAYFASNQLKGVGGWDIYSFDLHDNARPERVLFLKGDLLKEDGQILDNIEVEIKNINTKEIIKVRVDSGSYISSLTLGKDDDVLVTVKKEGLAFSSTYISSDDTSYSSPSNLHISMQVLEKGKSFNIHDVYFDNNSFEIKDMTKEVLVEFAKYLRVNKTLIIEINGFTDNVGEMIDNQLLSENRAKVVVQLLLSEGISSDRMSFNGYGESYPVADNSTEEGRSKNRRTEFKIIE